MKITLIAYPDEKRWLETKQRALVTVWKTTEKPPSFDWKKGILKARHSPIRHLEFSFYMEGIPSYISAHLARHVHAQPYISSQRNDRQDKYDREAARQDAPVNMIYDINAEELMTIANKRLCFLASPKTREVVRIMCDEVLKVCPEFEGLLVPACQYNKVCHEMYPCNRNKDG